MFRRLLTRVGIVFTIVIVMSGAATTHAHETVSVTNPNDQHCVVRIEPLLPDQTLSASENLGCFSTFSEAIAFATDNSVILPVSAGPEDVTQESLPPPGTQSQTIIGIQWENSNRGGSSIIRTTTYAPTCTDGTSFGSPGMESGWNDRISSAEAYSGCNNFYHYEHTNYTGAVRNCNTYCATMGVMDNQTSSWRLTR